MRARNVNGTSRSACKCGSWLQHWLNHSNQPLPRFCSELRCLRRPTVGAYVQKEWALDDKWYIVPLCAGHSAMTGHAIELAFSTIMVPVDTTDACGKGLPVPGF